MNVNDTVFAMMRAFPTLYTSRVYALAHLFDSNYTEWVDGKLVDQEFTERDDFLPYSADKLIETGDPLKDGRVVFHRRENAKAQFTHDNAHILAKDTISRFDSQDVVRFDGRRFDDMPAVVDQDWMEAAKELAHAIRMHKYVPISDYSSDYKRKQEEDLQQSVVVATKFLERFKVITPCPYERAARMKDLTREAKALGCTIVEDAAASVFPTEELTREEVVAKCIELDDLDKKGELGLIYSIWTCPTTFRLYWAGTHWSSQVEGDKMCLVSSRNLYLSEEEVLAAMGRITRVRRQL